MKLAGYRGKVTELSVSVHWTCLALFCCDQCVMTTVARPYTMFTGCMHTHSTGSVIVDELHTPPETGSNASSLLFQYQAQVENKMPFSRGKKPTVCKIPKLQFKSSENVVSLMY